MTGPFAVLTVCTANICRSPVAEVLLTRQVEELQRRGLLPAGSVSVDSAGVAAYPDAPACPSGATRTDRDRSAHQSRELTKDDLLGADLVLALARDHSARIAQLSPRSRPNTFTLRHAAHLGATLDATLRAGQMPDGAPPLPGGVVQRLRWWVGELDAARGLAGLPAADPDDTTDPMDVPDPHESVVDIHDRAYRHIEQAIASIGQQWATLLQLHHDQ